MLPIQTILHPTDFSDRSAHALQLACALARDYDARLIVLHVFMPPIVAYGEGIIPPEPQSLYRQARQQLSAVTVPEDVRAERRFEEGEPATVILHLARELSANLIVMGTHGRTGLSRLLMGSVAEQVVRRASCPVLTVATPFSMASPGSTEREREPVAAKH